MVTVAVCTFEKGPLLNLDSMSAIASRPDADVLLVDASVTPRRRQRLAELARGLGVRRVETPGAGLARQRNVALREATDDGDDALVFLDDDCLPRAGWLDALTRALASGAPRADVATARVLAPEELRADPHARYFDQDHGPRARTFTRQDLRVLPARPLAAHAGADGVAPWAVGSGSSFALRVSVARALGGFREDLGVGSPARSGEDVDFFFRVLASGGAISYVPDAQVEHHHRRRAASDYLRTAYDYAWGGREFLRRALHAKPAYALVLAGRPAQLLLIAARHRLARDDATARMCVEAARGWVGLPPTARAPR